MRVCVCVCVMSPMPTATLSALEVFLLFFSFTLTLFPDQISDYHVFYCCCWCRDRRRRHSSTLPYCRHKNTMRPTLTICLPLMPFNLFPEEVDEKEKNDTFCSFHHYLQVKVLNSAKNGMAARIQRARRGQSECVCLVRSLFFLCLAMVPLS